MLHWGRPRCFLILVRKDCKLSLQRQERFARGKRWAWEQGLGGDTAPGIGTPQGWARVWPARSLATLSVSRRASVRVRGGLGQNSEGFLKPSSRLQSLSWAHWGPAYGLSAGEEGVLMRWSTSAYQVGHLIHQGHAFTGMVLVTFNMTRHSSLNALWHQDLILPASSKFLLSLSCTCHTINTTFPVSQH